MRKLSLFMIIALVVVLVSVAFPLAEPVSADNMDRYGYSLLTNDKQKIAYEAIADGISSVNPEIKFSCDGIAPEDVEIAGKMIVRDYPEFFWYDGTAGIGVTGNDVVFSTEYKVNGQTVTADSAALTSAKNQIEAAINSAMAKLPANPSQYEIAHTFHDYVVNNVSYEKTGDHQTAYGALVSGKAVCAGYARAFQLLMNRAGIRCWYVAGVSNDPNTNEQVDHAWNLYWLDGKCYYSDATWDDQGTELFHEYLNMSLEEISKTHFTEDQLPASCNHNDYTFFIKNDGKGVCDIRDHKDVKDVAKCFEIKSQNGDRVEYYCTIHYHADDFVDWINEIVAAIVQELGYKSVETINIIELGHEHHVTISGQLKAATRPTEPSEPAPTTKPTEPAPITKPTDPAPTTKPTEPAPTTKPTEPSPTTKPTESTATTGTAAPSDPSDPTQQTTTQATAKPTDPSGTVKPSATDGTTQPAQSDSDTEDDSGKIVIIVAVCLAAAGGIGVAVYFFVIKKK